MDLFSTNILNGVVQQLKPPTSFLTDKFFPMVSQDTSEEIHFDVIDRKRRLAPFVSPLIEGKIVAGAGFTTKTFKPAYIKDKRVWDGTRALKRTFGEKIGGVMSPADRQRAILNFELEDQLAMLTRRKEWMAAQVLQAGSVTVVGDNYPSVLVNFGREATLTVALENTALWTATTSTPLADLQTWALRVAKFTGSFPTDVTMDIDAWVLFKNHADVKGQLTLQRTANAMPSLSTGAKLETGGTYMGTIDQFNIYVYSDWYVDDNGAEQPMLASGTVLMCGDVQGVQAHGAIRDEAAGYQALPYFSKSWVTEDPAVRYLLMQSAPLMVPTNVNATFKATIK